MTDERAPGSPLPPDPDFAPQPPAATPPSPPPPPLAPYANPGAATPPPPQPASGWAGPPPQQPAVAWAAPAPVAAAQGGRTTLAAIAGIALLIMGIFLILIGLLMFAGAAMLGSIGSGAFEGVPGMPEGFEDVIGPVVVVFGVIVLVFALLYIVGGIGVLRSRGWGRVLGIVVGILGGLLFLGSVTTPAPAGAESSFMVSAVLLAIHAYIVVVLIAFWRSKTA